MLIPTITITTRRNMKGPATVILDFRWQGRRHRPAIGPDTPATRKLAEVKRAQIIEQMVTGRYGQEERRARFGTIARRYLDLHAVGKRSERNGGWYTWIVGNLCGHLGQNYIDSITKEDVLVLRRRLSRQGRGNATVNRHLAILQGIFTFAVENGHLERAPIRSVTKELFLEESDPRARYLDDDEAERLEAVCPPWLRDLVVVARETGMRRGELSALTWKMIDLQRRQLHLPKSVTKAKQPRSIPISSRATRVLRRAGTDQADRVFLLPSGNPPSADWISHAFGKAVGRAGIEDFRFHDLRADFASRFIMKGGSPKALQVLLGHSSMRMTERYVRLGKDYLDQVARLLDTEVRVVTNWSREGGEAAA
jgi:integrase